MAELSASEDGTISALINFSRSGESRQSAGTTSGKKYDILDFLGVAQRFQLEFLPITWQSALATVGEGATAKIGQAMINVQTSFAFKLLKRSPFATEEAQSLRALVAEISVLGHYSIKSGSRTPIFHGICWDVGPGGEQVWPVLVYEKSQYGDLRSFMASDSGKALDFEDRVELILDVADSVRILHAAGVIHGDVKPENVLIYYEDDRFVAKVIDYGFSTLFATDSDPITMPYSPPWTAPEHHHRQTLPARARKMDAYSFGMLSLWLLFYNGLDQDHEFEKDLKRPQISVLDHASDLIRATVDCEIQHKNNIQQLFRLTLVEDPAERASDFDTFLRLLSHDIFIVSIPFDRLLVPDQDFQIALSSKQLIETHYAVRQFIAKSLEAKIKSCPTSGCHALSLAFCYELGFGVGRDAVKSKILLKENNIPSTDLDKLIEDLKIDPYLSDLQNNRLDFRRDVVTCEKSSEENEISFQHLQRFVEELRKRPERLISAQPKYNGLRAQGHIQPIDFSQQYHKDQRLREAETCYRREILSIGTVIGSDHILVQELRHQLFMLMMSEWRYGEAEDVVNKIVESDKSTTGEVPYLNGYSSLLATSHFALGRFKEAEELQVQILETYEKKVGQDHLWVLYAMDRLGITYRAQGRLEEAEKLQMQILERSKKALGTEHTDTLRFSHELGITYTCQGRWKEAEELQMLVVETARRVIGTGDAQVLEYMYNLARNYCHQLRWKEAEELQIEVLETSEHVLGMEYPRTVDSMMSLASIVSHRGRWEEAEELFVRALRTREGILGMEHADTLTCMVHLAMLYITQNRWKEAETLQAQLVETSKKIGLPDTLTINYMWNLASNYGHQSRWKEAEDLTVQVFEMSKKVLGVEHPDTLYFMACLATIYKTQQKGDEAARFEAQEKEIRNRLS